MKRKWLVALMGALVLAGIVTSGVLASQRVNIRFRGKEFGAYVRPERGHYKIEIAPRQKSEKEAVRLLPQLDLTPEQQQELASLRINLEKQTLELRTQLKEKQLQLKELLVKDAPDRKEIEALVDEMASIWAEIKKESINFGMKLKDMLTEEQWAKLGEIGRRRLIPGMGWKQRMFHGLW